VPVVDCTQTASCDVRAAPACVVRRYNPDTPAIHADPLDVSIVLVNWNACEMTTAAVRSIGERTRGVSFEIIVIDNASTEGPSAHQLPRRFPSLTFIPNARNLGFGAASNQGMARARGRYVLLLNTDTIQTEDAIGAAVGYMDGHADVGGLGILHRNDDAERSPQPSAFGFPRPWAELAVLVGLRRRSPARPAVDECDVDWLCGSFLMIRRECLDAVGVFDERFFVYDEDIDWCRRAWRAGWKMRFWPGTSMIHLGSAAQPFITDKTFMHCRSHLSYIRKHHSWLPATLYYLVMVGRLTIAAAWQTLRWMTGRAPFADVRERSLRQWQFARLRPSRSGV